LFAEESVNYASRLIAAGVTTELHVYPGCCHSFQTMVPVADVSKRFMSDMHRALKQALHS
jgi:acetyl esterase/lipase